MAKPAGDKLDRGTLLALLAMGVSVLIIANDFTAMNLALTDIEADFDSDITTVTWVINAYTLVFGVLIVTGGRVADLLGRRRMFVVGAGIFALFSLLGGLAPSEGVLIASRAVMGIGGALMWPAILGMTYAILPEARAGLAGGLILGAAGAGNAIGPLLGGALTEISWRLILFVNIPIAAVAVAITLATVHVAEPEATDEKIDVPGSITLALSVVSLLIALDQATSWGWGDPRTIGLIVVFVVLLVVFGLVERRQGRNALLPPDVLRSRDFRAAALGMLLLSPIFFSTMLFVPQFFQKISQFTPVEAGLATLPFLAVFAAVSFVSGAIYDRAGPKITITAGGALLTVGMFAFTFIDASSSWAALVPGMVLAGLGAGLYYGSITTYGVTALDPSRSSLAGGVIYMAQIAGGSIGLGITTAVFAGVSRNELTARIGDLGLTLESAQARIAEGILAGTDSAKELFDDFPGAAGRALQDAVSDAFASGFTDTFLVVGGIAVLGVLVCALLIGRHPPTTPHAAPATEPAATPADTPQA